MSDSIIEIRRRLQLAAELPEMLDTSNRAATHWRDDVSTLLTEVERLRAHVEGAETMLELGKAWWLARGHSRAVAEAAFGEAVGSYDPDAWSR